MAKRLSFIFFLAVCMFAQSAWSFDVSHEEKQALPALPIPKIAFYQLKNGLSCYLLEDHATPKVNISAWVKTGSIYEPAAKSALAGISGDLLVEGGTKSWSPKEFEEKVDDLAIGISSDISAEYGVVSLETLTRTLPDALALFTEVLFAPRFDEERVKLAKQHTLEALRREEDDPNSFISSRFVTFIYGKDSPWGRRASKKTVQSIKREDIQEFYQKYFVPSNIQLAISGDFKTADILQRLENLTGKFPPGHVQFPEVKELVLNFEAKEQSLVRPSLNQSHIRVGHLGVKRHNPDIYALQVMNTILGSSAFSSRLMQEIRVKRGLSYGVRSSFGQSTDYGLFFISTSTKASSTEEAISLIRAEVSKMARGEGLTVDELKFAKESIVNKLVFKFEDSEQIVNDAVLNKLLGYPDNYWQVYRKGIEAVTLADVKRVAAQYLHPEGLKVLVLGPKRK